MLFKCDRKVKKNLQHGKVFIQNLLYPCSQQAKLNIRAVIWHNGFWKEWLVDYEIFHNFAAVNGGCSLAGS